MIGMIIALTVIMATQSVAEEIVFPRPGVALKKDGFISGMNQYIHVSSVIYKQCCVQNRDSFGQDRNYYMYVLIIFCIFK